MIICLSIKIFNIYNSNQQFLFSSYHGFEIEGDTIIKYTKKGGNVIIPSTIDGVVITSIADEAFKDSNIDSVVLPTTLTKIGNYAFSNNNIKVLNIPSSVKSIGEGAFAHNAISELKMASQPEIGNACFNDNQLADEKAFFYKVSKNGEIDYSELISYGGKIRSTVIIPDNVEGVNLLKLGDKSLLGNNIVAVSIPSTVEKIGKETFKDNYLVEVYLSNNIKSIDIDAFSDNFYLTEIIIDNYKENLNNYPWGADESNLFWLKK